MNRRTMLLLGTAGISWRNLAELRGAYGSQPSHQVRIPQEFSPLLNPDDWSGGNLPRFRRPDRGHAPVAWMHDRSGRLLVRETPIPVAGAQFVMPLTVAATRGGEMWIGLEVWSSAGAAVGVLSRLTPAGAITQIQLGDFAAEEILLDRRSHVWLFGGPTVSRFERNAAVDFPTLLRLDTEGRLVYKGLPKSTFGREFRPSKITSRGEPQVIDHADRISIISPATGVWCVLDLDGNQVERFPFDAPKPEPRSGSWKLTQAVGTDSGRVFAHFYATNALVREAELFEFDFARRTWRKVSPLDPTRYFGGLFGADGDQLILRSGADLYGWFDAPPKS